MGKTSKKLVSIITSFLLVVSAGLASVSLPSTSAYADTNALGDNTYEGEAKGGINIDDLTPGKLILEKPDNWGNNTYVYFYDDSNNHVKELAKWPGVKLENVNDNIYAYQLPEEWQKETTKIIFNDGYNQCPPGSMTPGANYKESSVMICDGRDIKSLPVNKRLKFEDFTTDKQSPQYANTEIKITAGEVSGGVGEYKYQIKVDDEVISQYSSDNYAVWTPKHMGNYKITVSVMDGSKQVESITKVYVVNEKPQPPLTFKTDLASGTQTANTPITLIANEYGIEGLNYQFIACDSEGKAEIIQEYSSENTCVWIPEKAGDYTLTLIARDNSGNQEKKSISYSVIEDKPLKILSFNGSISFENGVAQIKLSAEAQGIGDLKYRFFVYVDGQLQIKSSQSTNSAFSWIPSKVGSFVIKVSVMDSTGKYIVKSIKLTSEMLKLHINRFDVNSDNMQVGTPITMSADAMGPLGEGSLNYRFCVYRNNKEIAASPLSSENTYVFTPQSAGRYTFVVFAKEKISGRAIKKYITYKITEAEI